MLLATPASPGQEAPSPAPSLAPPATVSAPKLSEVAPPEEAATVRYGNRPITVFGGRLFGRSPADRARAAVRRIEEVAELGLSGPVEVHVVDGVAILTVAGREAVTILPTDVDTLAGETVEAEGRRGGAEPAARSGRGRRGPVAAAAPARRALGARPPPWPPSSSPGPSGGCAGAPPDASRAGSGSGSCRSLARHARGDLWRTAEVRLAYAAHLAGRMLLLALSLLLAYAWLAFVLREFPYTRPWGEALRSFVFATLGKLGGGMVAALPGLFTVALIVLITRLVVRGTNAVFRAVEESRLALPGVYAETAQPTRRLAVALLWLFAIIMAYPVPPGQRHRRLQGHQRLRRPHALARLERPRRTRSMSGFMMIVLAGPAARRLREGRRASRARSSQLGAAVAT